MRSAEALQHLPRPVAEALAVLGVTITAGTHVAVLAGKLDHTKVRGGGIQDPEVARRVAWGSLLTQAPVALLVARASGRTRSSTRAERRALAALGVLSTASVPLQLAGTVFERRAMAPVAAALAIGLSRLALEDGAPSTGRE